MMSLSLRLRKLLHRPMARVLLQGLYAEGLRRSNTFSAKAGKRIGCPKVFKLNIRQKYTRNVVELKLEFENQNSNADSAGQKTLRISPERLKTVPSPRSRDHWAKIIYAHILKTWILEHFKTRMSSPSSPQPLNRVEVLNLS